MRLLVTRPQAQGDNLANELRERGHEIIVLPLLEIVAIPKSKISAPDVQAIIMTSAEAARHAQAHLDGRFFAKTVYAVGEATAHAAREAGFSHVIVAGQDARSLVFFVEKNLNIKAAALLYLCSIHRSDEIEKHLKASNFNLIVVPVYDARPVLSSLKKLQAVLSQKTLDGVLLFSPRTAALFRDEVVRGNINVRQMTAYCLSQAIAEALKPLTMRVRSAPVPAQESLINLLENDQKAR